MSLDSSWPSFTLKLKWAERHLKHFEDELNRFINSHPYKAEQTDVDGNLVWLLKLDSPTPPAELALIGADFVHNVRSALDHVTASLVSPGRRRKTYFPIFWTGVWEEGDQAEDDHTRKARNKWKEIVKGMDPRAVEILKACQPYRGYSPSSGNTHLIRALHEHWNIDKHSQFPYTVSALKNFEVTFQYGNGTSRTVYDSNPLGLGNNATVSRDPEVVAVSIRGTIAIAMRVASPDGFIELPYHYRGILDYVRSVVEKLATYSQE